MTTNSGIELLVYLKDGTTKYAYIPRFTALSAMDEMSSGPGANVFQVLATDPVLTTYPKLLDYRNVVYVLQNGVRIGAMIIQTKKTVIVDSGSGGTDLYVEISGEGLRTWFKDAELYPEQGIHAYSYDARYFNGSSGNESKWKNAAQWSPTPVIGDSYLPVYPGSGEHPWAGNPQGWPPQGHNAKWVWCTPYNDSTGVGYVWLRKTFTTTSEMQFELYATADNEFEAYMDGQLILTGADWRQMFTATFTIPAGTHVLAIKAKNDTGGAVNPAGILVQMSSYVNSVPAYDYLHSGDGNAGWSITTAENLTIGWTPGAVLSQILSEAQTRGVRFPSLLTQNFSSTTDSLGNPWQTTDTLEWIFNVGDNYETVISAIEAVGYEVWIDPVAMTINIAPQRGTDHTKTVGTQDAVILSPGKNLTAADSSGQANMTNVVLTKSSDGWVETVQSDSTILTSYGRLEGSLQLNTDGTTAGKIATNQLNENSATQSGSTYGIVAVPGATPKVDFNTGDWVLAPDENGIMVPRRVMSLTVTQDEAGNALWTAEFDTIFQEMAIRLQNYVNRITNGTIATGFSTSGNTLPNNPSRLSDTPAPNVGQEAAPAAPTGLACAMTLTWSPVGAPLVQVTLSWTPVTASVLGFDTYVTSYQVWGINQSSVNPVPQLLASPQGSGAAQATVPDLAYGATWVFYVVAVLNPQIVSPNSATLTQTLSPALPTLTAPTAPTLSSQVGIVVVAWDGNLVSSPSPASPAVQFRYVYAEVSPTGANIWTRKGAALVRGGGSIEIIGLTVGSSYDVHLIGVDSLGNLTAASALATVTVVGVSNSDLAPALVTAIDNNGNIVTSATSSPSANGTKDGDLWFQRDSSGNITGQWQWLSGSWVQETISHEVISSIDLGTATVGTLNGGLITARTIGADKIVAGALTVNELSPTIGNDLDISANGTVSIIAGQVNQAVSDGQATASSLSSMQTYYAFGPSGATISTPGSPFQLALSSSQIEILQNGQPVSYWNSGQMFVNSLVATEVVLGNHKLAKSGTGTVVQAL